MEQCFSNGGWAMLNNIHLVVKWLLRLEKIMENYGVIYAKMAQIAKKKAEKRLARRRCVPSGGLLQRPYTLYSAPHPPTQNADGLTAVVLGLGSACSSPPPEFFLTTQRLLRVGWVQHPPPPPSDPDCIVGK